MSRVVPVLCAVAMAWGLVGCGGPSGSSAGSSGGSSVASTETASPETVSPGASVGVPTSPARVKPLADKVIVLDPGHQLGNRNHAAQINAPVDAGGFDKPCNTTGTATDAGYPEATFTWEVALETRRLLRRLGARVLLTRSENSDDAWGPCIDERGRLGNPDQPGPAADLRLSIHADGVLASSARGFHVIAPGARAGWTDDIEKPSSRLAGVVRDALRAAGFALSTYTGDDGVDVRTDLGTLNHSDVPSVMVELANMRHPGDAVVVESAEGRARYARALARAVRQFLE